MKESGRVGSMAKMAMIIMTGGRMLGTVEKAG